VRGWRYAVRGEETGLPVRGATGKKKRGLSLRYSLFAMEKILEHAKEGKKAGKRESRLGSQK